jgi:hypothetical protein
VFLRQSACIQIAIGTIAQIQALEVGRLQSNKAALVNTNGLYRIVPADQAIVGA